MSRLKLVAFLVAVAIISSANGEGSHNLRTRSAAEDRVTNTAAAASTAEISHEDLLKAGANSAKIYSVENLNNVGLTEVHEATGPILNGPNVCTKHEE